MQNQTKTQNIRLMDVFILAPFMVWFGFKAKGISEPAKIIMIIAGFLTAAYNGANYLKNEK